MRLRGHHLFCTTLFQGCGYDQAFTDRMWQTLSRLEAGEQQWLSVCGGCRWQKEGLCSWEFFQTAQKKRFG